MYRLIERSLFQDVDGSDGLLNLFTILYVSILTVPEVASPPSYGV